MNAETLKEIYWGRISPYRNDLPKGSPAYAAYEKALNLEGDILEAIDPDNSRYINELVEAYLEYIDCVKEQLYIDGVRMGGRLMLEILGKGKDRELLKIVE